MLTIVRILLFPFCHEDDEKASRHHFFLSGFTTQKIYVETILASFLYAFS